jgi:hypothetical protein
LTTSSGEARFDEALQGNDQLAAAYRATGANSDTWRGRPRSSSDIRGCFAASLARTDLGIAAFGCQIFELPPNASAHRHSEVASGQQELYVNLAGDGWIEIDEHTVEFGPRTLIHVTPESIRLPHAGRHGLTYLCVGASADEMYRPNPKFA